MELSACGAGVPRFRTCKEFLLERRISSTFARVRHRSLVAMLFCFGCGSENDDGRTQLGATPRERPETPAPLQPVKRAQALLTSPTHPGISGTVTFQALPPDGTRVDAEIFGLEPGSVHAMHLHAGLECDDWVAQSPHFDGNAGEHAGARPHGDPNQLESHLGDLGNVVADDDGHAVMISRVRGRLTIDDGGFFDIVGRVVVLHTGADDFISDVPDASGPLLACGKLDVLATE
jgi:Cu-Zn family superoxide dismutase